MAVLYRPRPSELDATDDDVDGNVGCTAYAYAIGVDTVSGGGVTPWGTRIRLLTNEAHPSPGDPGLTLEQVDAGGFGVNFALPRDRWSRLVTDLADFRWVVLQVWYPALGAAHMAQRPASSATRWARWP